MAGLAAARLREIAEKLWILRSTPRAQNPEKWNQDLCDVLAEHGLEIIQCLEAPTTHERHAEQSDELNDIEQNTILFALRFLEAHYELARGMADPPRTAPGTPLMYCEGVVLQPADINVLAESVKLWETLEG